MGVEPTVEIPAGQAGAIGLYATIPKNLGYETGLEPAVKLESQSSASTFPPHIPYENLEKQNPRSL